MLTRIRRRRAVATLRRSMEVFCSATEPLTGMVAEDTRTSALLRSAGRALGVNRVFLADVARKPGMNGVCLRLRYEWTADGTGSRGGGRCLFCRDLPPGWEERLQAGQPVQGISTPILMIPLPGPELCGALGFQRRPGVRRWRRFEIGVLRTAVAAPGSVSIGPCSCDSLHAVEACYRAIVEDLTDPLCRLSPEGIITYANEPFCAIWALEPGEIIGLHVQDVLPPDIVVDLPIRATPLKTVNPVVTREFRVLGADDGEHWYRNVYRAILDDGGAVCAYQMVCHDITERKHREARNTWMNDQKLALLADAASDAIVVLDSSARITYWNRAAEDLFGYTGNEVIGGDVSRLFPPGHPYRKYLNSVRHAATAVPHDIARLRFSDVTFARKEGSVFPAELSIAAVQTWGEWYSVGIVHDTSAQKAREHALLAEMERTATLLRIAARMNGTVALDAVLDTLCEETARALRVPVAVVFLHEHERDLLVPRRSFGVPEEARDCVPCIPRAIYERETREQGPAFVIDDPVSRGG